jgi:1-acyl-sn-glycerol-3-phosphate acyltransferase
MERVKGMHFTIYDTPVIKSLMRWLSLASLKITGWRAEGRLPDIPKFVLIAAPHTSNWDFPIGVFTAFALKAKIYWMGKDSLFRPPFGLFFRWLGGIPVDRSRSNNVVEHTIRRFINNEKLIVAIPPSGTRKKVMKWKTGFYYIARGAGVPVVLAFMDYRRKAGGFGPVFIPTGDIESDIKEIRAFYSGIHGKNTVTEEPLFINSVCLEKPNEMIAP